MMFTLGLLSRSSIMSSSSPSPDRKAIEELWRQRLKDAKLRVDFAQIYLKEVVRDFPPREISNADGNFAYQRAVKAENSA